MNETPETEPTEPTEPTENAPIEPTVSTENAPTEPIEETIEEEFTVTEQFIMDNSDELHLLIDLGLWWGFIGIPLVCIVALLWACFKEFIYTRN